MFIEEELKTLIEKRFGNVKTFSNEIDLPYTTVRSILQRGILNSNVENVISMSEGLGFEPEDLIKFKRKNIMIIDEEQTLIDNTIDIMKELNVNKKEKVYSFAELQLEEQNKIIEFPKKINVLGQTAAGAPVSYGDSDIEEKEFKTVPKGAQYALNVKGDSMEPLIPNGSIVFYKEQQNVESGEIAILEIDGDGVTCKKVYFNYEDNKIILRSLNDKYEDVELDGNQVRIIGRVVL